MINILRCELIKLKRSSLIAIIIVLTLGTLFNGASVSRKLSEIDSNPDVIQTIYDFSIGMYTLILLPTIIIVTFALIMKEERVNGGMKEMFILPVTRIEFFVSKLIVGISLVLMSILIFGIGVVISGYLNGQDVNNESILIMFSRLIKIFLVSLGTISIQFFLGLRYENIGVSLGLGICFVLPTFLINSSEYKIMYPWSYITAVNNSTGLDENTLLMIAISILIFVVVNWIGYKIFKKEDINL